MTLQLAWSIGHGTAHSPCHDSTSEYSTACHWYFSLLLYIVFCSQELIQQMRRYSQLSWSAYELSCYSPWRSQLAVYQVMNSNLLYIFQDQTLPFSTKMWSWRLGRNKLLVTSHGVQSNRIFAGNDLYFDGWPYQGHRQRSICPGASKVVWYWQLLSTMLVCANRVMSRSPVWLCEN